MLQPELLYKPLTQRKIIIISILYVTLTLPLVYSRHGVIVIGNSNSNSKDYMFLSNSNSNSNRHFKFYCNSNSNS